MAPEQIIEKKYSRASDVFAFAVTCYEIITKDIPWKGLSPVLAAAKVVNGEFLPIPEEASATVARVMEECFKVEPSQRPTFDQIMEQF